jgi:hypothetical protein
MIAPLLLCCMEPCSISEWVSIVNMVLERYWNPAMESNGGLISIPMLQHISHRNRRTIAALIDKMIVDTSRDSSARRLDENWSSDGGRSLMIGLTY